MRKIIGAIALTAACLAGCSSGSSDTAAPAPSESSAAATPSAPVFDQDAERYEAWQQTEATYPAALKLTICDAAKEGGAASVKAVLTDPDQMPFVVEDPEYDSGQWVKYCASK
ncbi:hypothetical protein ACWGA9_06070 [Streptomyces sp. NPDC054950]